MDGGVGSDDRFGIRHPCDVKVSTSLDYSELGRLSLCVNASTSQHQRLISRSFSGVLCWEGSFVSFSHQSGSIE
jgi:hypothetical protein